MGLLLLSTVLTVQRSGSAVARSAGRCNLLLGAV